MGGIRSATFNLGILQALARLDLLKRVDYLSTVSGGGYIGAWLSGLYSRRLEEIETDTENSSEGKDIPKRSIESLVNDEVGISDSVVNHLRKYSNYLTPNKGLFSLDVWTAVTTYLRNLIVNLSVLLPILLIGLLVPYMILGLMSFIKSVIALSLIHI